MFLHCGVRGCLQRSINVLREGNEEKIALEHAINNGHFPGPHDSEPAWGL